MSDHPMIEDMKTAAKEQWKNRRDARAQEELRAKLAEVGPIDLAKMTDIELAAWQSHYPTPSPQATLALFEWQRRLTAMQVTATKFGAVLGLIGVVLGVLLTFAVTWWSSHSKPSQPPPNNSFKPNTHRGGNLPR